MRLVWAASAMWVCALAISAVYGRDTSWLSWESLTACAATAAGAVLYVVFFVRLDRR